MRPSTILQILKEITWRNATHHFKDGRRPEAEKLIHDHYKALKLEKRGVEKAEVTNSAAKSVSSPFHGGDGHQKEHVTVQFKDAKGEHVTTHHVRGPRDNK